MVRIKLVSNGVIIMNKIGIIGCGNVGLAIIHELCTLNTNLDIIIIDSNKKRTNCNIIDFNHMLSNNKISYGHYSDISSCDIIVISSGINLDENRTVFLQNSYRMIKKIMHNINNSKFNGQIIVVSNPNDVLTTYVAKNYLPKKVIGTGCMLDINRLKYYLNNYNVNGIIIGEHGPCQEIVWESFKKVSYDEKLVLEKKVKSIANEIVKGKGFTNYGIASCVVNLIKRIFLNKEFKLVASFYDEKYQIAYSYPLIYQNGEFKRDNNFIYSINSCSFVDKIKNEYRVFENQKIIGVDLDDTITDIQDEMKKYGNIFDKENNGQGIIYPEKYFVGEMYNWNKELKDKFFRTYRHQVVENAKLRKDVIKYFNKWKNMGYKIFVITSRNSKYYTNPYEETFAWLKKHGVPFDELYVESFSKKDLCQKLKVNYFVDDMPNNCNEVSKIKNVSVFIMDNGNNIGENEKVIRIKSFKEIDEVIKNEWNH